MLNRKHSKSLKIMRKIAISLVVNVILFVVIIALLAQQFAFTPNVNSTKENSSIDTGSSDINFTQSELQTWLGIKNRIQVLNTDPNFADQDPKNRVLGWYSMRNSSSKDYYQKSMEFLMFWEGRGADGEWEAVISIYNVPDRSDDFVVEFSRFTWNSIRITLDGAPMAEFQRIQNDTVSLAYTTFHVTPQ
jgi:hypothetical protein